MIAGCIDTSSGTPTAASSTSSAVATSSSTPTPTQPAASGRLVGVDTCAIANPAVVGTLGLTARGQSSPERGVTQCLFTNRVDASYVGVVADTTRPFLNFATPADGKAVVETVVDGRRTATVTSTNGPTDCLVAVDFGGTETLGAQSEITGAPVEQNCANAQQLAQYAAAQIPNG